MSTLRRASVLRVIFELGSFTALEVSERSGASSHYVQNLITEYAHEGYLVLMDKVHLQRPGPPQKVWVLEPSKQGKLLAHIAPLYETQDNASVSTARVSTSEHRAAIRKRSGSPTNQAFASKLGSAQGDEDSLITYHFVQRPSEGSAPLECSSTRLEILKTRDSLVIKDVLDQVYRSDLAKFAGDRVVMLDENKISSGAATLYSCLYKRAELGIIVHLQYNGATFTIAVGESVEFSRTRHFSSAKATPEVDELWRKLTGGITPSVLKNWSDQPKDVFATIIEGLKADFAFFSATHPDRSISNILLSGIAPVYSVELVRAISQKFGVPCEASDPLRVIRCDSIEDVVFVAQNPSGPIQKFLREEKVDKFDEQLGVVYKSAPLIGYAIRSLGHRTAGGKILIPSRTNKPLS
ncbi:MAG TPA: hypothetical protein VIH91_10045 [Terriglobales bacterium]